MTSRTYYNGESLQSSDSDDYPEIFYSPSSYDRSSVGSIPWAEDAIKQNQIEWELLERMFYGEEQLPAQESELKTEIIEWQNAFPHLRVNGKRYSFDSSKLPRTPKSSKSDEVLAIDPPPIVKRKKSGRKLIKVNNNLKMHAQKSFEEIQNDCDITTKLFERDLRISSVPMLSKRRQLQDDVHEILHERFPTMTDDNGGNSSNRTLNKNLKQNRSEGKIYSMNRNSEYFFPDNLYNFSENPTTSSTRVIRMPPILNLSQRRMFPQATQLYVATSRPQRPPVILPALHRKDFQVDPNLGRSISAAYNERIMRSAYLPNSASKLKFFK